MGFHTWKWNFLLATMCALSLTLAALAVARATGWVAPYMQEAFTEGFTQDRPFVLKRGLRDCYDDFYVDAYPKISGVGDPSWTQYFYDAIMDATNSLPEFTVLLDIGCGCGDLVQRFAEKKCQSYGVDISPAFIRHCATMRTKGKYFLGDARDAMMFESATFTHITCTMYTLYYFQDKVRFLQTCYAWLKPRGCLCVHVVATEKLSGFHFPAMNQDVTEIGGGEGGGSCRLSGAGPTTFQGSTVDHEKKEADIIASLFRQEDESSGAATATATTGVSRKFEIRSNPGFLYQSEIEKRNPAIWREIFQDSVTGHIRQNEIDMYLAESEEDIVTLATEVCGFDVMAVLDLSSAGSPEGEKLYIFRKS